MMDVNLNFSLSSCFSKKAVLRQKSDPLLSELMSEWQLIYWRSTHNEASSDPPSGGYSATLRSFTQSFNVLNLSFSPYRNKNLSFYRLKFPKLKLVSITITTSLLYFLISLLLQDPFQVETCLRLDFNSLCM